MLFRCGTYLRSLCCQHNGLSRYFCSKAGDAKPGDAKPLTLTQKRVLDAQQWFEKLSPEMIQKKKRVENEVQLMKEQGIVPEYEVTAADIKHLMLECNSFTSMKRYLLFMQKNLYSRLSEQEKKRVKREARAEDGKRLADDGIDMNTFGVSHYTTPHHMQAERSSLHRAAMSWMNSPTPIVFDMDYSVAKREEIRAFEQISHSISANKYFPEPCSIHLTSALKNNYLKEKIEIGFREAKNSFLNIHEEGFEDVFPREKLVYLSPDAPPLGDHRPGDIYIIGGLVDLKDTVSMKSLRKAQQLNIRCGSIPFVKHGLSPSQLRASSGYVLTLNAVFEILLNLNLKHQWKYVMKDIMGYSVVKRPEYYGHVRDRRSKRGGFM